jgi:hypothetical protein
VLDQLRVVTTRDRPRATHNCALMMRPAALRSSLPARGFPSPRQSSLRSANNADSRDKAVESARDDSDRDQNKLFEAVTGEVTESSESSGQERDAINDTQFSPLSGGAMNTTTAAVVMSMRVCR